VKSEVSLGKHFFGTATVGERGQIVIPSEARKKMEINPGDKLLVVGHPHGHGVFIFSVDQAQSFISQIQDDLARLDDVEEVEEDAG